MACLSRRYRVESRELGARGCGDVCPALVELAVLVVLVVLELQNQPKSVMRDRQRRITGTCVIGAVTGLAKGVINTKMAILNSALGGLGGVGAGLGGLKGKAVGVPANVFGGAGGAGGFPGVGLVVGASLAGRYGNAVEVPANNVFGGTSGAGGFSGQEELDRVAGPIADPRQREACTHKLL
ncbi:PE-PGRS family protein PE_PGRS33-like [Cydia pomonella]|uniref:PE-PGRS family protein PE_PGRS33-like n=1 Tax=Cydia pomonella TaxID=82600 RepID=UPI002ADD619E|nr:PE-PGRS family protein PE_PGRS33-like [Cydia pomonella]